MMLFGKSFVSIYVAFADVSAVMFDVLLSRGEDISHDRNQQ